MPRPRKSPRGPADWRGSRPAAPVPSPVTPPTLADRHRRKVQRWFWRGAVLIALVALLLAFIDFVFRLFTSTPLVFLGIADYEPPWPPNAMVGEDCQRFQDAWLGRYPHVRFRGGIRKWASPDTFQSELDNEFAALQPGWLQRVLFRRLSRPVVLVYISALGALDEQNEPCLMLATPATYVPEDWSPQVEKWARIRVRDLLTHLGTVRPEGWQVVLLLDSGRVDAQWPAGVLYNGFAERLAETVRSANVAGLVVLNSTGPGQVGWSLPERGCSAFGDAVRRGLQGAADRAQTGNRDRQVSMLELYAFVRDEVRGLVQTHRSAFQEPMLLPPPNPDLVDFALAVADAGAEEHVASSGAETVSWEAIQALWAAHQDLHPFSPSQREPSRRIAPSLDWLLSYMAFEQGLRRLEQLHDAGIAYQQDELALLGQLRELQGALQRHAADELAFGHSLAMVRRRPTPATSPGPPRNPPRAPDATSHGTGAGEPDNDLRALEAWQKLLGTGSLDIAGTLKSMAEVPGRSGAGEFVEFRALRQFRPQGHLPPAIASDGGLLRAALRCRDSAEIAAALQRDIRTLDFCRPRMDVGDRVRRQADDGLFTGQTPSAAAYQPATDQYDAARRLEIAVADALYLRDRIWYEAPHWARWAERSPQADLLLAKCGDLLVGNAELEKMLEDLPPAPGQVGAAEAAAAAESRVAKIASLAGKLDLVLEDLRRSHRQEVEAAIARRDRLAIAHLLGSSLVTLADRLRLRQTRTSDSAAHVAYAAPSPRQWQTLYLKRTPPVALLLGLDEQESDRGQTPPAPDRGARRETDPARLLRRLVQAGAATVEHLRSVAQQIAKPSTAGRSREQLGEVEQRVRRAATLLKLPPAYVDRKSRRGEQVTGLLRFHERQLYLWQAERCLEDFLGNDGAASGTEPYFAVMARNYLQAADQGDADQTTRGELEALRKRLDALARAAPQWAYAEVGEIAPLIDAAQDVRAAATFDVQPALPTGQAAVFATTPQGQRAECSLRPADARPAEDAPFATSHPLPTQAGRTTRQFRLRMAPGAVLEGNWSLACYFRGHFDLTEFRVPVAKLERVITWNLPPYADPQVQVVGDRGRGEAAGSVAIVLDCSRSMAQFGRLKPAQDALATLLLDLREPRDHEIVVWVLGHRRGLNGEWNNAKLDDEPVFGDDNPEIQLDSDVQRIERGDFQKYFGHEDIIRALGMTPLRLALMQAFDWLAKCERTVPRRLIVLTDGAATDPELKNAHVAAALQAANGKDPRQSILVTFIIDVDPKKNDLKYLQELTQDLAQAVGEKVGEKVGEQTVTLTQTLMKPRQFVRDLNLAMGIFRYHVFRQATPEQRLNEAPLRLNEPLTVSLTRVGPAAKCSVRLTSRFDEPVEKEDWIAHAHVAFEGGENLVLQIQEDRQAEVKRRLVHQRYDWEILDQAAVTNPAAQNLADLDFNPTEFFVAAHAPEGKRVAGGTPFRISIQNHDPERFSPRPQEVWAEVTPVRIRPGGKPEETGAPYVFYEPAFEAKRPVPILEFIAHQWPGAEAAHVRLWFKLRRTPPLERRIEEVLSATADDWTIKTDAVKFAVQLKPLAEGVEGCQVVVAEQHAAAGDAFSTKVELSERPDAIRRDYYPAAGLVMHTFEYKQSPQARLHKSWLFITSAADLKEDAVQLAEPLLVRVPADQ